MFKKPLQVAASPARKELKLLDMDTSIFRNFNFDPGSSGDDMYQPSKRHKRNSDGDASAEDVDIFNELDRDDDDLNSGMCYWPTSEKLADDPDYAANDNFDLELDEHCDFTLIQYQQGTQMDPNKSRSLIDEDCNLSSQSKSDHHTSISTDNGNNSDFGFSQSFSLSQFEAKGDFFGMPDKVRQLVQEHKGISKLYDWQTECLNLKALQNRQNLIYALPTSSGKTLVAEILIFRELICHQRNVLFILPFVSIVKEKIAALSPFAVDLDFFLEEYAAGQGLCPPKKRHKKNSVFVGTIEKSLALVDSLIEADRLDEVGLVVVDELHLLGEPGRGAILETILTKVKYKTMHTQIVGMSATIGNLHEVERFLNAVIFRQDFRPVELKEYLKCGKEIFEVNKSVGGDEIFKLSRTEDFGYTDDLQRVDPDHIGGLVKEVAPKYSLLIFCPIKKNCQDVAINLTKVVGQDFLNHRRGEKERLLCLLKGDSSRICDVLQRTIPFGIAYHHSGLTMDERRIIEDAYRSGVICVICCTSTLAAGVNLPAKRVIIRSPYVGREFLTQSRYKQMIGRAGRAGFDVTGESVLVVNGKDKARVHELIDSPMNDAITSMHLNDFYGLKNLILSAISLRMAKTIRCLKRLCLDTFMAVQAERLGINVKVEVERTIKSFFKMNALAVSQPNQKQKILLDQSVEIQDSSQFHQSILPTCDYLEFPKSNQVVIKSSSQLEISAMGRAAVKACVDLVKARKLYEDLKLAQRGVVLLDYFHLLYIVTPPDVNIYPKLGVFYEKYNKLTPDQLHTAKMIGITESLAVRIATGKSLSESQMALVNRFFVTMILQDLWNLKNIFEVSIAYNVNRGLVQNLMSLSASYAVSVLRFCEEIKEFWAFEAMLKVISNRLKHCCTAELMPLMELPSVRLARAKQLYASGFRTLEIIAQSDPADLVRSVEFLSKRQAKQIVSAAIVMLKDKMDTLQSEVDILRALIGNVL